MPHGLSLSHFGTFAFDLLDVLKTYRLRKTYTESMDKLFAWLMEHAPYRFADSFGYWFVADLAMSLRSMIWFMQPETLIAS